jgi:hypothetical protein
MTDEPSSTPAPEPGSPLRRRRRLILVGAIAGAAALAVVLVWFQPQKLFIDDEVDEAFPEVVEASPATVPTSESEVGAREGGAEVEGETEAAAAPASSVPDGPVLLLEGEFTSLDHPTSGRAFVAELPDGSRVLRLEDLVTDNGPDLLVYLSAEPIAAGEQALDDDIVDLGRLKGNVGNQNYDLPADVDLERYATVVIWCKRFASGFGAADLA